MKSELKIILICSIFLINSTYAIADTVDLKRTYDWQSTYGTQIYFFRDNGTYMYTTINGTSDKITGYIYFYTNMTATNVSASDGIYAAVGFGSETINGSDIVICRYIAGLFDCTDACGINSNILNDTTLGGINNVLMISATMLNLNDPSIPYKTLFIWKYTKDILTADLLDWNNLNYWQTNYGNIFGLWGRIQKNRSIFPSTQNSTKINLTMNDGQGLDYILNSSYVEFNLAFYLISLLLIMF